MTIREWIKLNWKNYPNRIVLIKACRKDLNKSTRSTRHVAMELEQSGVINWESPELAMDKPTSGIYSLERLFNTPKTVEELMEISELDPEIWEVTKQKVNFWGNNQNSNYQVTAFFKKYLDNNMDKAITWINKNFKAKSNQPITKLDKNNSLMAEIMLPDLHLGRVNTEGTATLKLVAEEFTKAIDHFISSVIYPFSPSKIVLVLGNDFFNSSNYKGETAKGTKQTEHPIWEETFKTGISLALDNIEKIQQASGVEVEVIFVVGNHDFESSFYLAQVLRNYFSSNPMVTIQDNLDMFKFTSFGKNLIGYTHKCPSKAVSLPLLMADRKPQEWANSTTREWHTAHIHHKTTKTEHIDVNGVRIKSFPTITAHGDWEQGMGYSSKREGTCMLWDFNKGCIAEFYYKGTDLL